VRFPAVHGRIVKRAYFATLFFAILASISFQRSSHAQLIQSTSVPAGLHVVSNVIIDGQGNEVLLHGVNRSGAEYSCITNSGIWDGPGNATHADLVRMTDIMLTWHINAVRVPLNEDCWVGVETSAIAHGKFRRPALNSAYYGAPYQAAIVDYVGILNQHGIVPILSMHFGAPKGYRAYDQEPMPDSDYTAAFWQSVVQTFANNSSIIFDVFNEPAPFNNDPNVTGSTPKLWACWQQGGDGTPGSGSPCDNFMAGYQYNFPDGRKSVQFPTYKAASMPSLVQAIRNQETQSNSVTHILVLDGVQYADSLTRWLENRPSDANLAAGWHPYNFNICGDNLDNCWNGPVTDGGGDSIATVMVQAPLIAGELGEDDCQHTYIDGLVSFLDANAGNYTAWTWNAWYPHDPNGCQVVPGPSGHLVVIKDDNGTPFKGMGVGFKAHMLACSPKGPWICGP
jgi:endoglucanase